MTMGGMLPIVFSEIVKWLDEYQIYSPDSRDKLIYFVQAMDESFLEHARKMSKAAEVKDNKTKS